MTKHYIALDIEGGWFIAGSIVELVADCAQGGAIMRGQRRSTSDAEGHPPGTVYEDEELCAWEEFELVE